MVEADAYLEDALVKEADPAGFLHPSLFEILVALVELALIEFLHAFEDEFGNLCGDPFVRLLVSRAHRAHQLEPLLAIGALIFVESHKSHLSIIGRYPYPIVPFTGDR